MGGVVIKFSLLIPFYPFMLINGHAIHVFFVTNSPCLSTCILLIQKAMDKVTSRHSIFQQSEFARYRNK